MCFNYLTTICLALSLLAISTASPINAGEASTDKQNKVWVGKYVTNKISPKMKEQHEINTVCQKIRLTENHPLNDIANAKVQVKGKLTNEFFVIRYSVPAKELHLIKHNSKMFCAIEVAAQKKGTFLSRPVTFVSGESAVTDGMDIEITAEIDGADEDLEKVETSVFKCKDKRGNPVFQDSPCDS